jgi:hypothetical protein
MVVTSIGFFMIISQYHDRRSGAADDSRRTGLGVRLVFYSAYNLAQPASSGDNPFFKILA